MHAMMHKLQYAVCGEVNIRQIDHRINRNPTIAQYRAG